MKNINKIFKWTMVLLIVVSVVIETANQVESLMLVRNYKGFLND